MAGVDPAEDPKPAFEPVDRNVRLVDKVVDALTQSIVAGRLEAGDRLPSERDLCQQFGVSRPVVREAIGSLNARGLLDSSPNRGHTVKPPGRGNVTESLTLYLRGQGFDYVKLMEARMVIEVENAALAARRATAEDLVRLRDSEAAMSPDLDAEAIALVDTDFHLAIATASGNEFLGVVIESLREVILAAQFPRLINKRNVATVRRQHREIVAAIASGDESRARLAMQAHLQDSERRTREASRDLAPAPVA